MKKRIALEITGALGGGGYKRYTESILKALVEEGPENEYLLFGVFWRDFPRKLEHLDLPKSPNVLRDFRRFPQGLLFPLEEFCGLRYHERFLLEHGVDIVHGVNSRTPPLDRLPSTTTLHFSELWDFKGYDKFYFNTMTERTVRQCDRVIAISEHCKRSAFKAWGTPADKIDVIYYGSPTTRFTPPEGEPVPPPGVERPYFLFVGFTRPHKNPKLMAEAFCKLKAKRPDLPHRLVFAGGHGPDKPWIEERLAKAGLLEQVVFTGIVPQENIHKLFQAAYAFVCPSLDEGFALPVVEAMGCGIPVIGVNAGALPEVIGDAGLVPEPTPEAFCEAMERLILEPGLHASLRAKGFENLKRFDWNASARKTLAVYDRILAERGRK